MSPAVASATVVVVVTVASPAPSAATVVVVVAVTPATVAAATVVVVVATAPAIASASVVVVVAAAPVAPVAVAVGLGDRRDRGDEHECREGSCNKSLCEHGFSLLTVEKV
jgi:hypothetical protein